MISPFDFFLSRPQYVFNSFYYCTMTGFFYPTFFVLWVFLAVIGVRELLKAYRISHGLKKLKISYVLFSLSIGFGGGLTNFFPGLGIYLYPVGNLTLPIICFLTTYAVLNYRLIDFRVALMRTGLFITVYAIIVCILYYLSHTPDLWRVSPWITLFIASAGPFIYVFLRRRAEKFILREQLLYHNAIRELSAKMVHLRHMDDLLKTIVLTIVKSAGIQYAVIYLKEDIYKSFVPKSVFPDEVRMVFQEMIPVDLPSLNTITQSKKPLLSEEIDGINVISGLIVPFVIDDALDGFMVLGPKKNHQAYTPDDMLAFESLSYFAALAIENCRFWKEIEDRQRKARLQEMDTYSYSLAHEIDNPMQVILGEGWLLKTDFLSELKDDTKRKNAAESFDYILEAAKRVSGMVKAIRDFGQATTGEFDPLNIEEVVDSFERLYYPQFKAKTVFFKKTVTLEHPAFVSGEKPSLMQVLVILANNSIHAMKDHKEKNITLRLEQLNSDWVRIAFSDNGYGIKQDMLSVIFTPFTTTKASTEGTGMGLHNAKMIVEHHKGRIWAESRGPETGATFFVELPILKGHANGTAETPGPG